MVKLTANFTAQTSPAAKKTNKQTNKQTNETTTKKQSKKDRLKHPRTWYIATSFSFTDRRHGKSADRGGTCMLSNQSSSHTHIQSNKQHRQTKQTHIRQLEEHNLAFLIFAGNPAV
jgi:hypothetical protein